MNSEPRITTLNRLSPEDELRELLEAYKGTWRVPLDEKQREQNERNRQALADTLYAFNVGFLLGLKHGKGPEPEKLD